MLTMRRKILLLSFVLVFLLIPGSNNAIFDTVRQDLAVTNHSTISADIEESTPWWNTTFHYRMHVNLTDTNSTTRVDVPTHVWLTFENNTCYKYSIRVVDSNNVEVPSQVYNYTYWENPNYVKSATVFWYANISADSTSVYWVYFSELTTIEQTNYDSVVWFARTTGALSGKFDVNYWSFRGEWYNVTMYNAAGGKITNGAHKKADGTWDWNWGTNRGSMHWNPDGLGGQATSATPPISGTTFVNINGPLFINYTTQLPFGSYAKLNVTYTFYKWGWITRIYIKYTASTGGSGRTDEWVFYPYLTIEGIEVAPDGTQTYYSNWAPSSNKGLPAGFGWWNNNGISHGTVRILHEAYNMPAGHEDDFNNYYYRWWDTSSYEFWDTYHPSVTVQAGTVLKEECAFAVWNGAEGEDGYMRVFNATSRYLPIFREISNVSSYSFRINVKDLGGNNIEGANVTLLNPITGARLYKPTGAPYTDLTDSDGNVTFIGLLNQTYRIDVWIDTTTWLTPEAGATGMNVTWSGTAVADGPFTPVSITLDLASITIHLDDLAGDPLGTVGAETVKVWIYNASDPSRANWKYMDYETTDSSGDLTFYRLPKCDWLFNFTYSNTDTGHIYTKADFGLYVSHNIDESLITDDLTRSWVLPLTTIDFYVEAYDGQPVENTYVRISKAGTADPIATGVTDSYNITHMTDANGNVTFYRVLKGNWTVVVYRTDDYGQTAYNTSEYVYDTTGYAYKKISIPLTWLRIRVVDNNNNRVTGAKIDLYANGVFLVTAYSDSAGEYNFHWIKANDTSIGWSYTVTISKNTAQTSDSVYASYDYLHWNTITLTPPAYTQKYTELNCTASVYSWYYADNGTFQIGWFNRTSTSPSTWEDQSLNQSEYFAGTMNFTISHNGVVIGFGVWNSTHHLYISHYTSDGIYFTIAIDTLLFKMNASNIPYIITIKAETPNYDAPEEYTVTVVISVASTTRNGATSLEAYYLDGFAALYSLTTNPSGRDALNLTDLDFTNYTIYDSDNNIISTGNLTHLGSGIYRFSDSNLNTSDVGSYEIVIWLHKLNYMNHTFTLTVTINAVLTELVWTTDPSDYTWGTGISFVTLEFRDTVHGGTISGVSVTYSWIDVSSGTTVLVESSSSLTYLYANNIVANGTYRIYAYATKQNYLAADSTSVSFLVSPASTSISLKSSDTITIEWGSEYAEFDFDYVQAPFTVAGASVINIDWTGEYSLVDYDNGTYTLRMLAVQEAANYTVTFTMWIENRTKASETVYVNVLIPLDVSSSEGKSLQDPIQEYWTRSFMLQVIAGDQSNQSEYVSGVIVTYNFPAGGISGTFTENATGQYYWLEFPASLAPGPGVYEIQVEAARIGCTGTSLSIYIEVLPTPTRITAQNQLLTVYYADSYLLNFSWSTTIDTPVGIEGPDNVHIELWKSTSLVNGSIAGIVELGNGDYQFLMDTRMLGMTADSPLFPTSYYFVITMNKLGYEEPLAVTIIILVLQTPTEMTADPIEPVIWSEDFTVRVHIRDIVHNEYVWTDASVYFIYEDINVTMTSLGNGTFVLTGDSADYFSSSDLPHSVTIIYTLPNYVDGQIQVEVQINPKPAYILNLPLDDTYDWTDTIDLTLDIIINGTTTRLEVDSCYFYWKEYPAINGTLAYDSIFNRYLGTVNTKLVPAGNLTLVLAAVKGNYTIPEIEISLEIKPLPAKLNSVSGDLLTVIYGLDQSAQIIMAYTHGDNDTVLEGARITFIWNGLEREALWSDGQYIFEFNPSSDTSLEVPGTLELVFTAALQNYTTETTTVLMRLAARTEIVGGPYRVESEQYLNLIFKYWDVVNDRPVGSAATVQYQIGNNTPVTVTAEQFDGTQYIIRILADDIGEVSPDPYQIRIFASAPGYQNWTVLDDPQYITVYVDPPTVQIPLIGLSIERSTLFLVGGVSLLFILGILGAIAVQRMRIPYQIKQINKALKAIENDKKARVEGIKSMGTIIWELLEPGLATLNITPDVLGAILEAPVEEEIALETEELLDELEALEDIEAEPTREDAAYEEELVAELEEAVETAAQPVEVTGLVEEQPETGKAELMPEAEEETTEESGPEEELEEDEETDTGEPITEPEPPADEEPSMPDEEPIEDLKDDTIEPDMDETEESAGNIDRPEEDESVESNDEAPEPESQLDEAPSDDSDESSGSTDLVDGNGEGDE